MPMPIGIFHMASPLEIKQSFDAIRELPEHIARYMDPLRHCQIRIQFLGSPMWISVRRSDINLYEKAETA